MALGSIKFRRKFHAVFGVVLIFLSVAIICTTKLSPVNIGDLAPVTPDTAPQEQGAGQQAEITQNTILVAGKEELPQHDHKAAVDLFELHKPLHFARDSPPDMCVILLSCKRPLLLKRTVSAFVSYMHTNEPNITYEMILWDNGSERDLLRDYIQTLPIDRFIFSRVNVGIAYAFDQLIFQQCRSPYILSLEEDWEVGPGFDHMPLIQMAMNVIDTDEKVLEVWLRYDSEEYKKINETQWMLTPSMENIQRDIDQGQVMYHRQQGDPDNTVSGAGSYTNGASLKSRARLEQIGRFQPPPSDTNGETWFQMKVNKAGYACAHLCMVQSSDIKLRNRCSESERGVDLPPMFVHIGTNGRSPGHQD
ncbi:hypothetical protein HK103_002222 [Boothiomyces macroporosus]|uniref:Uncharacterized protein n=1 Tax=Boothiomyces macroporosus TaxID=261099 RepID=A0AAD5UDE2_9FUNG|nr:hypothetical protein HK103_002219 [Boothiomyces macroporosus]KAJ3251638.1 hypothetical protein HK103_002222 [Boothiomyces macroporosus]